jgi:two-component system response regulator PilR (NtrC family)
LDGDTKTTDDAVDQDLIGQAPAIQTLRKKIAKLARSQAPVHINGESGSGKEVAARLIHKNGPRATGAFVAVNCGAIPPELMESELFGHVKGSFTGASQNKIGLFQAAAGGTLFLDEVADLPLAMQVKLLRAIQEKSIRPVGANEEMATDIRLLSATHKDLSKEVEEGRFREDLYYRINVIDLHVPSLRERAEDIPMLANAILSQLAKSEGNERVTLDDSALDALSRYNFPGNVRELENMLERAFALSDGELITADDIQLPEKTPRNPETRQRATDSNNKPEQANVQALRPEEAYGDLEGFLDDIERQVLSAALEECRWNKTATAKKLGISFRSLRYRLKKLGLEE